MPGIPDKQALLVIGRRVLAVVNMLLLVVFCAGLAQWTWRFAGPESKPLRQGPDVSKQAAQLRGQMAGIFFAAESGDDQPAEPPLSVTLIGVFSGHNGFAIVRANDQTQAVVLGDEIVPGARLTAIKPRAIEIQRDGQTQEVSIATAGAAAAAAQGGTADTADSVSSTPGGDAQGANTVNVTAQPAAGAQVHLARVQIGRTRIFFTSRELAAAVQKISPQSLFGPIQQANNGGWELRHVMPDSPAYWIGLRSRDVLTAIDGTPIQDDSQIYALQQRLQQTGKFVIAGRRAGKPLTLVYTTEE